MLNFLNDYPILSFWIFLALGLNIILIFAARDVGLQPSQWFWLIVLTSLVAGACAWIVNWGDDEEFLEK